MTTGDHTADKRPELPYVCPGSAEEIRARAAVHDSRGAIVAFCVRCKRNVPAIRRSRIGKSAYILALHQDDRLAQSKNSEALIVTEEQPQ